MTIIQSIPGKSDPNLVITRFNNETTIVAHEGVTYSRYRTADLLAALDATANTDVQHRADAYEDATRWQTAAEENERWADEWKRKAEESEANASAQIETASNLRAERDEWKARAEKAEATIARVEAVLDGAGAFTPTKDEIRAALDPKPAFTLPTEAGVKFEARYGSEWETYTTYSDGNGNAIYRGDGGFNDGDYIMRCYVDHRLLGAES
jgi:hypothetical protein